AAPKDPQNDEMMQMRMMRSGMWNSDMMTNQQVNANEREEAPPVIADGKVVFTAPARNTIDCLNLRDGSKAKRTNKIDSDPYLAGVYAGKVLLVGKEHCRALDLKDGSQAWTLPTGMPSGRGVASDNIYYLPLEKSAQSPQEPEVCSIDVAKG